MAAYLVTGSARGIGHELVQQLASKPDTEINTIFATSRSENLPLKELTERYPGRVIFVPLTVGDETSMRSAVPVIESALKDKGLKGLDVLINNAGIVGSAYAEEMADLDEIFHVNVTGPHTMIKLLLPLLRKGNEKKVINISSSVGSITRQPRYKDFPAAAYKVTKAALNMLTVVWSQELGKEGFTFLCQNPGWLQTDEANGHADLPVGTGVGQILEIAKKTGPEGNGRFLNIHVPGWEDKPGLHQYDGKDLPW
jgi:NAD(P)-dependent dehydrogenase (short-subunit alcohol dehydrogenase family)